MSNTMKCLIAGVFTLASVLVVLAYRGKNHQEAPRSRHHPFINYKEPEPPVVKISAVQKAFQRLQGKHPDWETRRFITGSGYFMAPGHYEPTESSWRYPHMAVNYPATELANQPFEPEYWKGIVFVQDYAKRYYKHQGWYGPVLVKDRILFYGDQEMLAQVDKDLK
jgi:hypothetical protein